MNSSIRHLTSKKFIYQIWNGNNKFLNNGRIYAGYLSFKLVLITGVVL